METVVAAAEGRRRYVFYSYSILFYYTSDYLHYSSNYAHCACYSYSPSKSDKIFQLELEDQAGRMGQKHWKKVRPLELLYFTKIIIEIWNLNFTNEHLIKLPVQWL